MRARVDVGVSFDKRKGNNSRGRKEQARLDNEIISYEQILPTDLLFGSLVKASVRMHR